jgi:hypothetical protein
MNNADEVLAMVKKEAKVRGSVWDGWLVCVCVCVCVCEGVMVPLDSHPHQNLPHEKLAAYQRLLQIKTVHVSEKALAVPRH